MAEEPPAPPPQPAYLDDETTVERIQAITGNARTVWFTLIAFLAFIGLTLTSVRGLDSFSATATTQLPIVNIAIPTTTFFWSAGWLVIWLASPLLLAAFWWRSMPAHDARLTLAIGVPLLLGLFATLRGWRRAWRHLTNPSRRDTRPFWWCRGRLGGLRRSLGVQSWRSGS